MLTTTLLELAAMTDAIVCGTHDPTIEGLIHLRDMLDQCAAMARLLELDAARAETALAPIGGNVIPFRRPPVMGGVHDGH